MLSIVIPCYNEAEAIKSFERELFPGLEALGEEYEAIAVDDGSLDGTAEALADRRVRVLTHETNRGLGAALLTGLSAARGEFLAFLDADLTFHPRYLKALLDAQRSSDADCVCGSPFLKGGMSAVGWSRRAPSLALNALYRALFDRRLSAYTPMFRLYRTKALRALDLRSRGFEISAEILVKLLKAGRRVIEVPVPLASRTSGESKIRRWRELRNHSLLIVRLLVDRP